MTRETGLGTPDISHRTESPGGIIYDGINLTLDQGTGIAPYTRLLTQIAGSLGYDVGVVYDTAFAPDADPLLQEVLFFDQMRAPHELGRRATLRRILNNAFDQILYKFTVRPSSLYVGKAVIDQQYVDALARHDRAFICQNILNNSYRYFNRTAQFVDLSLDPSPKISHCTFPLPLRVRSARNIYTIHDTVSLRLLSSDVRREKTTLKLLKKIADSADHIVTVSETVKRDIVSILKINETRVTNTYQAATFPQKYLDRSEQAVADYLDGFYGLEMHGYLLFFGKFEPKKNIGRLIDAFRSSHVDIPLVLVTARGWHDADDLNWLGEHEARQSARNGAGAQVRCLNYVGLSALVSLIRGARAVVLPSLYEGFGLPVLQAMMLGTPVVTSTGGALGEISGDAALLVDPYDVLDIARGITTIVNDADMRRELSRRGKVQAAKFSVARYRERVRALYASLA